MQLFYAEDIDSEFDLSKDESRHLIRVLRKTLGDSVIFTDGMGGKYWCDIIDDNPKKTRLKVVKKEQIKQSKPKLTIAIAPTKNMDRIEWFLEKSTEIGIYRIIPILCAHSERKVIKNDRLEKIIVSAMKQSLKYYKPMLSPMIRFDAFLEQHFSGRKFIAHLDEANPILFQNLYKKKEELLILIGPEGDFSPEEIALATSNNFEMVSLGNSRLRTETAGVVACHSFNFMNEK